MAGIDQMERHRQAHGSEADETDSHRSPLTLTSGLTLPVGVLTVTGTMAEAPLLHFAAPDDLVQTSARIRSARAAVMQGEGGCDEPLAIDPGRQSWQRMP